MGIKEHELSAVDASIARVSKGEDPITVLQQFLEASPNVFGISFCPNEEASYIPSTDAERREAARQRLASTKIALECGI